MIVFTVIIGGYDSLKSILGVKNPGWKYICITDDLSIEANGWTLIHVSKLSPPVGLEGNKLQRWVKVIGGVKFFGCDTIYLDGSHELVKDVTEIWRHVGKDIALKRHPSRSCYIDEGEACKRLGKAEKEAIEAQINEYKSYGLPVNYGMYETGIILRKYISDVVRFCELWYGEIERHTHRDQLSITWALFETGIQFNVFEPSEFNKYIKIHRHK